MRLMVLVAGVATLAACQPQPAEEAAAPAAAPTAAATEIAFIANAEAGTVSLLDTAGREIVGIIDINPDKVVVERPGTPNYAQDTDISPDGRILYVSRGYMGDVAAFDIASGKQLWVRDLDTGRADHMTLTPDGRWLFVSVLFDDQVEKIDAASGEARGRFATGVYPHDNQISADGRHVYNTSLGLIGAARGTPNNFEASPKDPANQPLQFTVADVETLEVVNRIPMPFGIRPWHMNPKGTAFYAQASNLHAVLAFDFPSGKESKRLDLPVKPGVTEADWDFEAIHHGLAMSHDGSMLCLAGRASDYAALVKAPELELIATVPMDDAPGWAAMTADDRHCLIANTRADTVSIISIADRTEIARLPAGDGPKHITVATIPAEAVEAVAARQ